MQPRKLSLAYSSFGFRTHCCWISSAAARRSPRSTSVSALESRTVCSTLATARSIERFFTPRDRSACEQSGGQRLNELQPLLMPLPSEWLVEQERAEPLHHEHQVQTVCTPLGQLPAVRPLSLGCEAQQATIGCGSRVGLQVV